MIENNPLINKPIIRGFCFYPIYFIAILFNIPAVLLQRSKKLYHKLHIVYSIGFLTWFITLKLGMKVPKYNICNYIDSEEETETVIRLINKYFSKKNSFFLNKLLFILHNNSVDDKAVFDYISEALESHFAIQKKIKSKESLFFEETKAFIALNDIQDVFDKYNYSMFLVSGTLLGCIRDKKFVESEYDIDVGFFEDEVSLDELYECVMSSDKFKLGHKTEYTIQVTHNTNIVIDLFAHFKKDDLVFHGTSTHHWYNSPFSLTKIKFGNQTFLMPENYQRYLDENYGNWQTPVAFWFYSFDTPNQVFPKTFDALFFLLDIILYSNDRYKIEGALNRLKSNFNIDYTGLIPEKAPAGIIEPLLADNIVLLLGEYDVVTFKDVELIQSAKSYGDYLVAGVYSDNYLAVYEYLNLDVTEENRLQIAKTLKEINDVLLIESDVQLEEYLKRYKVSTLVISEFYKDKIEKLSNTVNILYT